MTDYFPQTNANANPKFHLHALLHNHEEYLRQLQVLRKNGSWSSLSSPLKGAALAALWMARRCDSVASILKNEACGIADISKMVSILDKPRQKRQLIKKIQTIKSQHPHLAIPDVEDDDHDVINNRSRKKRRPATSKVGNHGDDVDGAKPKRRRKIDKIRRELQVVKAAEKQLFDKDEGQAWSEDTAVEELYNSASVSGAMARHLRKWAGTLTTDALEFVMMEIQDKTHWKNVADVVHFAPENFKLPYFLGDVHGEAIPDDCFVSAMRKLLAFDSYDSTEFAEMFKDAAEKFPQVFLSYPSLRLKTTFMQNVEIVGNLAKQVPLETLIWYFEEMYQTSKECASILEKRLDKPGCFDQVMSSDAKVYSFGKLMERILMFQKKGLSGLARRIVHIATNKHSALVEKWDSIMGSGQNNDRKKILVIGDASSSMQTAVEAAAIFAGFCSSLLSGELVFFNHNVIKSPHPKPSTVNQLLEICNKIRASGATSLAAGLGEYFENKVKFDAIVLVTDEEENTAWKGRQFARLFDEYRQTVNPDIKLVVVCVGGGDWRFRESLKRNNIDHSTIHIDESRPDLTKFDGLIGDIAYNCLGLSDKFASLELTTAEKVGDDSKDDTMEVGSTEECGMDEKNADGADGFVMID